MKTSTLVVLCALVLCISMSEGALLRLDMGLKPECLPFTPDMNFEECMGCKDMDGSVVDQHYKGRLSNGACVDCAACLCTELSSNDCD